MTRDGPMTLRVRAAKSGTRILLWTGRCARCHPPSRRVHQRRGPAIKRRRGSLRVIVKAHRVDRPGGLNRVLRAVQERAPDERIELLPRPAAGGRLLVLGPWVGVWRPFQLSLFLTASRMALPQDPSTKGLTGRPGGRTARSSGCHRPTQAAGRPCSTHAILCIGSPLFACSGP